MEICNVELVGTLMQINQFKSEKNILDVILEIKSEFCHTKDEYKTEKFTVLLYKTLNFDNKNLIVGKKIKIKGKIYGNLYRGSSSWLYLLLHCPPNIHLSALFFQYSKYPLATRLRSALSNRSTGAILVNNRIRLLTCLISFPTFDANTAPLKTLFDLMISSDDQWKIISADFSF